MVEGQVAPCKADVVSAAAASQRIVRIPGKKEKCKALELTPEICDLLAQVISETTNEVKAPLRKKSIITLYKRGSTRLLGRGLLKRQLTIVQWRPLSTQT